MNESLHRDYDLMLSIASKRSSLSRYSPHSAPIYGGDSALAKINMRPERYAAVLCMELCYSDCVPLKERFQNEYERDCRFSLNCKLFFAFVFKILAISHTVFEIAFQDLKFQNILRLEEWPLDVVCSDPNFALQIWVYLSI
jgi:hypothetical protein